MRPQGRSSIVLYDKLIEAFVRRVPFKEKGGRRVFFWYRIAVCGKLNTAAVCCFFVIPEIHFQVVTVVTFMVGGKLAARSTASSELYSLCTRDPSYSR